MSSGDESKTEMKELMDKFNKYAKQGETGSGKT